MLRIMTFMRNLIALDTGAGSLEFYDESANTGSSVVPFLAFMLCLIGIVLIAVGIGKYVTAKHSFNLFYDERDKKVTDSEGETVDGANYHGEKDHPKEMRNGKIIIAIGIVVFIASFILM